MKTLIISCIALVWAFNVSAQQPATAPAVGKNATTKQVEKVRPMGVATSTSPATQSTTTTAPATGKPAVAPTKNDPAGITVAPATRSGNTTTTTPRTETLQQATPATSGKPKE